MHRNCTMDSRIILLVWAMVISQGWALCYFPAEFQGEFLTQSSSRTGGQSVMHVQYASVTVLAESIPVWGVCHKRIGKSVLLMDRTGGTNCVRCFQLTLRSPNVLQIHTEGLEKCYTTEEAALATCPTPDSIANRQSREIMLYKNKEPSGEVAIAQEYCPINGRFRFTYSLNDGLENSMECQEPASELSNCPYGFGLHVRFRRCSFGDMDINFQCLGDWAGRNGERYLALLDMQDSTIPGAELRPKYRCAVYKEDTTTGKVQLALSSDSTCQSDLKSAVSGYETLALTTVPAPKWPPLVEASSCRFPDWSQGHWQNTYIHNDMMVYKDHRNFRTYTARCVEQPGPNGKFAIYARTQCGDELYTCMWLQRRADNVIEFQLGMQAALNYNHSLCQMERFEDQAWITQGIAVGQEVYQEEACPISGEYTGVIPDAMGLCAKLHSDCRNPQMMLFTISNCYNTSEVYEEREYRCLGQWSEKGLTYTYTQRRDVVGYECFAGIIVADGELIIKEAGENCLRDVEPMKMGMKLTRQASCYSPRQPAPGSNIPVNRPLDSGRLSTPQPFDYRTTKPWKPITSDPRERVGSHSAWNTPSCLAIMLPLLTFAWTW